MFSLDLARAKFNVAVIVGSEIKTSIGDVTGLFLSREITSSDVFEVIDEIRKQDDWFLFLILLKVINLKNCALMLIKLICLNS